MRSTFDGTALVGDACGFVDPVTGEGISFARRNAEMLSASLIPALHAGPTHQGVLDVYMSGRWREIEPRARMAKVLQSGLRRPWLVRAAMSALSRRPAVADWIVSVTGDYVPLGELMRPAVWGRALLGSSA